MSDVWCDVCNSVKFGSHHKCPPLWEYTEEDPREGGEFGGEIRASSAEQAADRWGVETFGGEWRVRTDQEVWLRQMGTETIYKFSVSIELAPSATSYEVESFQFRDDDDDPDWGDEEEYPDEDDVYLEQMLGDGD